MLANREIAFGALIPQICAAVNATVNATASLSSTGSVATTAPTALSTSTLLPVTAGTEILGVGSVTGLVFGVLGIVVGCWVL